MRESAGRSPGSVVTAFEGLAEGASRSTIAVTRLRHPHRATV
jgi:hypothetical protein